MTEDDKSLHDFKNQMGIILGFCDLLIEESAAGDPRRRKLESTTRPRPRSVVILHNDIK